MTAFWIIDQLVQQGVVHFSFAPGSRNTPLVSSALSHPKVHLHQHFDERGLGFFALGLSKAKRIPVAVIVTSGTAVGNLLPSVMEASHSFTPLLLLTADRPCELRDCGANQTTEQRNIFTSFVRWKCEIEPQLEERTVRSFTAQASFYALTNPPGPVHLNCSFREPLYQPDLQPSFGSPCHHVFPKSTIEPFSISEEKGLLLVGQLPNPDDIFPILKLADRLQWPLCADILSNARLFPTKEQRRYFDWNDKPKPEVVLHFGERMTSKKILAFVKESAPQYLHVSPFPSLQDPERIITGKIQTDIPSFCRHFSAPRKEGWIEMWPDEEPLFPESSAVTEVHAIKELARILPKNYAVFFGNGMPIRDADHFFFPEQGKRFFANRGLSGIDGNIATIAGIAQEMPVVGWIGDLAALYDLNSIPLLLQAPFPAVLIISNNFGSGIFHHLAIRSSPHFEKCWASCHPYQFSKIAEMFTVKYGPFSQLKEFLEKNSSCILELCTDREENYLYQKKISLHSKKIPC